MTKESLRAELQLLEQRLNTRFESLEQRMTIRLGSMLVIGIGIGIVATLVRLL